MWEAELGRRHFKRSKSKFERSIEYLWFEAPGSEYARLFWSVVPARTIDKN